MSSENQPNQTDQIKENDKMGITDNTDNTNAKGALDMTPAEKTWATREAERCARYIEGLHTDVLVLRKALDDALEYIWNGCIVDGGLSNLNAEARRALEFAAESGTAKATEYAEKALRLRDEIWDRWDEIAGLFEELENEFPFCNQWAEDAKADDGNIGFAED